MSEAPKSPKSSTRRAITLVVKVVVTVAAFYFLFNHTIDAGGEKITIFQAVVDHVAKIELADFLPWVMLATCIKFIGILSSMLRWHVLLQGQGIRFNFTHIIGSFLIGRFLGTFLPSTVGLDGYKLYDAVKFSGNGVRPAAATAVEKVMGMSGIFLTFLVTLPLGYIVLGENAGTVVALTVPIALCVVTGLFLLMFRPGLIQWGVALLPTFGRGKLEGFVQRASTAAAAYRGKGRLLVGVICLSFMVHFTTAAMYYFTALAVGAVSADFWQVSFASSIQIFATVISPFTIGGEGVREIVQALLLTKHIGASESIVSAALGFIAAEAMTMVGAVFLWTRSANYKPRVIELDDDVTADDDVTPDDSPDDDPNPTETPQRRAEPSPA